MNEYCGPCAGTGEYPPTGGDVCSWCDGEGYPVPNLAACDYYQGVGSCSFGCWEEPACMTDRPLEGWPALTADDMHPGKQGLLPARRYQRNVSNWLAWLPFKAKERGWVDPSTFHIYPTISQSVLALNAHATEAAS